MAATLRIIASTLYEFANLFILINTSLPNKAVSYEIFFFKLRLIVTLVFLLGFFALSLPAQIHAIGLSHACAAIHAGAISGVAGAGGTNGFR